MCKRFLIGRGGALLCSCQNIGEADQRLTFNLGCKPHMYMHVHKALLQVVLAIAHLKLELGHLCEHHYGDTFQTRQSAHIIVHVDGHNSGVSRRCGPIVFK